MTTHTPGVPGVPGVPRGPVTVPGVPGPAPGAAAGTRREAMGRPPQQSRARKIRRRIIIAVEVVLILVLAVIALFFMRLGAVPSPSMEPTLLVGDVVVIERFGYMIGDPQRGDIVVFHDPGEWVPEGERTKPNAVALVVDWATGVDSSALVAKRVIATPGDTVSCCEHDRVLVNGSPVSEPFTRGGTGSFETVTLGPGEYWVMGDNRGDSADSRVFGPIPREAFVGRILSATSFLGN